jgi:hypothetical protein
VGVLAAGACIVLACAPGGATALFPLAADAGGVICAEAGIWTDLVPEPSPDPALEGQAHRFFAIRVVDMADGSPVAGAQLETTSKAVYTSDANGNVAFYEPGLMGRAVYFLVSASGYSIAPDPFGNRGAMLQTTEGGTGTVSMTKTGTPTPPMVGDLQTRLLAGPVPGGAQCHAIRVLDSATGRGVPLAFVTTPDETYVTDSQGIVAYCNPDHIGSTVSFGIASSGYQASVSSEPIALVPGANSDIELVRVNIAERLYRTTGQGIYRDSILLGLTTPSPNPVLDGQVTQQDSAAAVLYQGQLFWVWGDTDRPSYPLGNLDGAGGTSKLPDAGGLDPRLGIALQYVTDSTGFARAITASLAPASQPTWISSPVAVQDATGTDRLFVSYVKPNTDLSTADEGLLRYDDQQQLFVSIGVHYPTQGFAVPTGQPVTVAQDEGTYVYYGSPVRVPATAEALVDTTNYETWSALGANGSTTLQRTVDGGASYAWRTNALVTTAGDIANAGLGADQALDGHLTDVATGASISMYTTGGAAWSDRRKRFLRIFPQLHGSASDKGEVWLAEGDTPMGPWVYATKVLTHDGDTFLSPWVHPYFSQDDGRFVFFEGAYTAALATGNVSPTPYYDRNQILYRLDLADPRLALPVAVYDATAGGRADFADKAHLAPSATDSVAPFFALDRAIDSAVPVAWSGASCAAHRLVVGGAQTTFPVFYALPPGTAAARGAVPLYEFIGPGGQRAYDVTATPPAPGFLASSDPIAYVWANPLRVVLPVGDFRGPLVASAGPDQCLTETGPGEGADVALDASASRDSAASIVSYQWTIAGQPCPVAFGATVSLHLPPGIYGIRLQVTDAARNVSTDDEIVNIATR